MKIKFDYKMEDDNDIATALKALRELLPELQMDKIVLYATLVDDTGEERTLFNTKTGKEVMLKVRKEQYKKSDKLIKTIEKRDTDKDNLYVYAFDENGYIPYSNRKD